jgi:hypothetical protein
MDSAAWLVAIAREWRDRDQTRDFSLGGRALVIAPDALTGVQAAGATVYLHANDIRSSLDGDFRRQTKSHGLAQGWRFVLFTRADFRGPELDDFEGEPVFTWEEVLSALPGTPAVHTEIGVLLSLLCQGYLIAHSARRDGLDPSVERALRAMGWSRTNSLEGEQHRGSGALRPERKTEEPPWWGLLRSRNMKSTLEMLASEAPTSVLSTPVCALVRAIFSRKRLADVRLVATGFLSLCRVSGSRPGAPRKHKLGALPLPRPIRYLVLLYSYSDRRLAKGICQVLRTLGVRPKLQNMCEKLVMPPPEMAAWVLWSSACGASLAREFLLNLDPEVALRTTRSLSFVNVDGLSSSLLDYFESCGAGRVAVHRIVRGLREFGATQFKARRIVYASKLGQEVRKAGHGYEDLQQYSKQLKNILPWVRPLTRSTQ